jgi:flagellar hook-associated protein FlgK
MADMLGTGLSSLRALQRALDTTAHNIANVSTEGYTRQRVEFETRTPQAYGSNWIGSGVNATQVRRVYDQFLAEQARSSSGTLARLEAFASQAERLDNLLGDTSNGLSASLQNYTDALNEVSSTTELHFGPPGAARAGPGAGPTACRVSTRGCAKCPPMWMRGCPSRPAKSPGWRAASHG